MALRAHQLIREAIEDQQELSYAAAADRGLSLQAFLLDILKEHAGLRRSAAMFDRLAHLRQPISADLTVQIVREARDHGAEVDRWELECLRPAVGYRLLTDGPPNCKEL